MSTNGTELRITLLATCSSFYFASPCSSPAVPQPPPPAGVSIETGGTGSSASSTGIQAAAQTLRAIVVNKKNTLVKIGVSPEEKHEQAATLPVKELVFSAPAQEVLCPAETGNYTATHPQPHVPACTGQCETAVPGTEHRHSLQKPGTSLDRTNSGRVVLWKLSRAGDEAAPLPYKSMQGHNGHGTAFKISPPISSCSS